MALSVAWRRSGQFDSPKYLSVKNHKRFPRFPISSPNLTGKSLEYIILNDIKIFTQYCIFLFGSMLSEDIRLLSIGLSENQIDWVFKLWDKRTVALSKHRTVVYRMVGPFLDYTHLPRRGLGFSRSLALCIVICVAVVGGLNRKEQHLGGGGSSYHNSLKIKTRFTNKAKIN